MLTSGEWSFSWNAENRMISATKANIKVEFEYDYLSRRISKKIYSWTGSNWQLDKHIRFVYSGFKLIMEFDGLNGNAIIRKYVWNGESPFSVYDTTLNATYYYVLDANKNVSELLDSSGNVVAHYEYAPMVKSFPSPVLMPMKIL